MRKKGFKMLIVLAVMFSVTGCGGGKSEKAEKEESDKEPTIVDIVNGEGGEVPKLRSETPNY